MDRNGSALSALHEARALYARLGNYAPVKWSLLARPLRLQLCSWGQLDKPSRCMLGFLSFYTSSSGSGTITRLLSHFWPLFKWFSRYIRKPALIARSLWIRWCVYNYGFSTPRSCLAISASSSSSPSTIPWSFRTLLTYKKHPLCGPRREIRTRCTELLST